MQDELIFIGTSDLSAHFRGKSFPASELPAKRVQGVGLAPTNLYMGALGPIQMTTFGTAGEVFLVPDESTRVHLPDEGQGGEHFYLGDFVEMDGNPWAYCPRSALRRALKDLEQETGWQLLSTFEQEFTYSGVPASPMRPYELDGLRRIGRFAPDLLACLRLAGITPDAFLAEFGPQQFEVTTTPKIGLRAADEAVITRELLRAVAHRHQQSVSLAPMADPDGVANGTHIHFSLLDRDGAPCLYDPKGALGIAPAAEPFVAGILAALPAICAISAASVASYYRLRPNRWAPVRSDLGAYDRAAALRVSPTHAADEAAKARQYNLEFRVADATGNPYLVLAALVRAGLDGLHSGASLARHVPAALPVSLGEALAHLENAPDSWLGAGLKAGYVAFKEAEAAALADLTEPEVCRRYAACY